MSVTSVLNTQTVLSSTSLTETESSGSSTELDDVEQQKVDFLKLLLTQLENQNPLDPMDTDEYTAQLTRYSQLEQQIEINDKMDNVSSLLESSATADSFNYIGQVAEVSTDVGVVQDGEATWSYLVNGSAEDVYLTLADSSGKIVYQGAGSSGVGAQSFTFDATEEGVEDGEALTLYVRAVDDAEKSIDTEITSHMKVEGAWSDGAGGVYLSAGNISFAVSDVLSARSS